MSIVAYGHTNENEGGCGHYRDIKKFAGIEIPASRVWSEPRGPLRGDAPAIPLRGDWKAAPAWPRGEVAPRGARRRMSGVAKTYAYSNSKLERIFF